MGLFTASMGPRLFSRGMDGTGRTGDRDGPASMGPRLFSRGMLEAAMLLAIGQPASMGPRLFSRGMNEPSYTPGFPRGRFNGAAAVQPRNELQPLKQKQRY